MFVVPRMIRATPNNIRGIAFATNSILKGWKELDLHDIDNEDISLVSPKKTDKQTVIRLPSYEQVSEDPETYAHASRLLHIEVTLAMPDLSFKNMEIEMFG